MLDLLLMLTTGDPSATETAGRLDYVVARCAAFGWVADETERVAQVEELAANQPHRSREEVIREFARGTRYAFSREGEAAAGATTSEAKADWTAEIEAHCDEMARDHPRLLRRTPETASRWARILADER